MNFAVEEGELWQFLKLNRKTAVRYRENPDGSYEILEENFKIISRKFHPDLIQTKFHPGPYFTLKVFSTKSHLGTNFTLTFCCQSTRFNLILISPLTSFQISPWPNSPDLKFEIFKAAKIGRRGRRGWKYFANERSGIEHSKHTIKDEKDTSWWCWNAMHESYIINQSSWMK